MRNDMDKIKVELSDGDHRPYFRKKVSLSKKDLEGLADDLWEIRQVELVRRKRRDNDGGGDDWIGGGKFF